MDLISNSKNKVVGAVGALGLALTVLFVIVLSPSGASAACNAADFTVGGVFDLNGYLACESAGAGGLPATGSQTLQLAGIALAFLAIGLASVIVSRQRRSSAS